MSCKIMVLPSRDAAKMRVINIPADMEEHEAYRYTTGVIAAVEEKNPDYQWEDIEDALEEHGFQSLEYVLGPALD
ncbi:MAG: hypothetical protein C0631_06455 [Sedimenticola sp.]|nr:MAG: hypothetical protein C0631_06455 [Sedimenticola sp.]